MTIAELLQAVEGEGITIELDGDSIKCNYRKSKELDTFVQNKIAPRKAEIVRHLNGESAEPPRDKKSPTTPAGYILNALFDRIASGKMPQLFKLGTALNGMEIGKGLVTVIGAPPGAGKTTLAMQAMFEALEHDHTLRAVVANRESSMEVLLQRELARRSGVDSKAIRFGKCDAKQLAAIKTSVNQLQPLVDRVSSLDEPGELPMLKRLLSEDPGLLILDYIQKFAPSGEARAGVTEVMSTARQFARAGWAVLAMSATARTTTKGKSSQDSQQLNQASFRDSSEIEFQADAAYLIVDQEPPESTKMVRKNSLVCVKNRHGERITILLNFNMPKSCFELQNEYAADFQDYSNTNISDPWGDE